MTLYQDERDGGNDYAVTYLENALRTSSMQKKALELIVEDKKYIPVFRWETLGYLVGKEVVAFSTRLDSSRSSWLTEPSVCYVGRLRSKSQIATKYVIDAAHMYINKNGVWTRQPDKYIIGLDENDEFEARVVHCIESDLPK